MFRGWIFLNSARLLLLVNFGSGFRFESMYMFLIVNIRLSLTHLHGFQLLVLLSCVLEAAKLAYANKKEESITSQKLVLRDFWRIADSLLNDGKSAILCLFNGPEMVPSAFDRAKLFAKIFSRNSNLE